MAHNEFIWDCGYWFCKKKNPLQGFDYFDSLIQPSHLDVRCSLWRQPLTA